MKSIPGQHFGVVDSTMQTAKLHLLSKDWGWVSAEQQTHGRGTHGRHWQSPKGNLYMTLGIRLSAIAPQRLGTLALEAGLVLFECLPSQADLWLKWPNDLMFKDAKVAGFLIEIHRTHVLIGLGVNSNHAPEVQDGGRPSARLPWPKSEAGAGWDKLQLGQTFADAMVERLLSPWDEEVKSNMLSAWSQRTRWDMPLPLRGSAKNEVQPRNLAMVWPMALTESGHLRVRHESGHVEELVAEYLW